MARYAFMSYGNFVATETQISKRGKCVKRFSIAFQLILDVEHSGGSGGERWPVK